jgi:outer membrane lipoprotein-sorting protein
MLRIALCAVLAGICAPAFADDAAQARAIIERSLKAAGNPAGDEAALISGGKGTVYVSNEAIPHTFTLTVAGNRRRSELSLDLNGNLIPYGRVFNGEKGWIKIGGQVNEMDKAFVREAKEELYTLRVMQLRPLLKDAGFTLSVIGEDKILNEEKTGDRVIVGVRVVAERRRDVRIWFDKQTGLPARMETTVVPEGGTAEVDQVTLYFEYKAFDGVKYPTKILVTQDGRKFLDREFTEYRRLDKVEESWFEKPE